MNNVANAESSKSSFDRAANPNILFNRTFCRMNAVTIIAISFANAIPSGTSSSPPAVNITIAAIAIRSCKSNIPRTILP